MTWDWLLRESCSLPVTSVHSQFAGPATSTSVKKETRSALSARPGSNDSRVSTNQAVSNQPTVTSSDLKSKFISFSPPSFSSSLLGFVGYDWLEFRKKKNYVFFCFCPWLKIGFFFFKGVRELQVMMKKMASMTWRMNLILWGGRRRICSTSRRLCFRVTWATAEVVMPTCLKYSIQCLKFRCSPTARWYDSYLMPR